MGQSYMLQGYMLLARSNEMIEGSLDLLTHERSIVMFIVDPGKVSVIRVVMSLNAELLCT